jgi:3-dehydroquinate synthase
MKEICQSVFWTESVSDVVEHCFDLTGEAPIVLVDESTHDHCWPLFNQSGQFTKADLIEIPQGEESKSLEIAEQVWSALTNLHVNRSTWVINLGGGVVTDLGGFISSTFKRGVNFINIPTTLLSMVDASVGGKTGINFGGFKNHIGVFSLPHSVCICPEFLTTLPEEHIRNGFAEMLKHGLIGSEDHWNNLQKLPTTLEGVSDYISSSVQIKADIVERDFRDSGERMKLNFGHSVGHAIEAVGMGQEEHVLHGYAVAAGMVIETRLCALKGLISDEQAKDIEAVILQYFEVSNLLSISVEELLPYIWQDKKNTDHMNFTLLSQIGTGLVNQEVTAEELAQIIA